MCTGCMSCVMTCSLVHYGVVSTNRSRIKLSLDDTKHMVHSLLVCQQCKDHPCYEACPLPGKAMHLSEDGIVSVDEENCIGCGKCRKACVFEEPRIFMVKIDGKKKALKCDLCQGIEGGPACLRECPTTCINWSDAPLPEADPNTGKVHYADMGKERE